MIFNNIVIYSGVFLGFIFTIKIMVKPTIKVTLEPKIKNKKEIMIDKSTNINNLKNSDVKSVETQTIITLDKNDTFLIKEIYTENNTKWYNIIDEIKHD